MPCKTGRLKCGGEASFFLDIFTSNFLCGFLGGLWVQLRVCVSSLHTTLRFRQQNWPMSYMTTKKMNEAVQTNN